MYRSWSIVLWEWRVCVPWSLLGTWEEKGMLKGGMGKPKSPWTLQGHSDQFGPASHPAQRPSLTQSLTYPNFSLSSHISQLTTTLFPSLTPGNLSDFPQHPLHLWKVSCSPLPKKPIMPLPPKVISIVLPSEIHKWLNSGGFFSLPMKIIVTCVGKYPWMTTTELAAVACVSAVHGRQIQVL